MSLYKYVTIESLKYILTGSIRFTQPGAFNDPFEMLPELYFPPLFSEDIKVNFSLTSKRRKSSKHELKNNFKSEYCNDTKSREIVNSLNQNIGILCLSEIKDSLLMWSHYADQYKGAVIEFDSSHDFFEGQANIEYREQRPKIDISSYIVNENQTVPISELFFKPKEWEYEKEIRIARSLLDCKYLKDDSNGFPIYVKNIPLNCIKSIILGERHCKSSEKDIKELWELIKETNIELFVAAVSNWNYEFRFEQIKFNMPISNFLPIISPRTAYLLTHLDDQTGKNARLILENHPLSSIVNNTV